MAGKMKTSCDFICQLDKNTHSSDTQLVSSFTNRITSENTYSASIIDDQVVRCFKDKVQKVSVSALKTLV